MVATKILYVFAFNVQNIRSIILCFLFVQFTIKKEKFCLIRRSTTYNSYLTLESKLISYRLYSNHSKGYDYGVHNS